METKPSILDSVNDFIFLMKQAGADADVDIDDKGLITVLIQSNPNYQILNNTKPITNHEDFFDMDVLLRNTESDFNQLKMNEFDSDMQNNVYPGYERETERI